MENTEWFEELFATIDQMDADSFASHLTEDARFIYGSQPAVQGKEAIRNFTSEFFGTLGGIGHNLLRTWVVENTRLCEGEVTYELSDQRKITLPFLNVFDMEGEKIREYKIYVDPTPLASE